MPSPVHVVWCICFWPAFLLLVSECRKGSGEGLFHRAEAKVVVTDRDEPAKLSLDFGFFYGEPLDPEGGYGLSNRAGGTPTRRYL